MEKWASFTRPRPVPKAGRSMEGWVKRQQVRQTQKYMKEKQYARTHTHKRGKRRKRDSLSDLEGYVVQHLSALSILLYTAAREERV